MRKGQSHPNAERSKKMMTTALLELMKEKEYKSITIKEICEKAQVARRTFYRNFKTKEEILSLFTKKIMQEFINEMLTKSNENYRNMIEAYYSFWYKHIDVLLLYNKNELDDFIFNEYLNRLPEVAFLYTPDISLYESQEESTCALAFNSGGLWSLLTYWVLSGSKQTPNQLAEVLEKTFKGIRFDK